MRAVMDDGASDFIVFYTEFEIIFPLLVITVIN